MIMFIYYFFRVGNARTWIGLYRASESAAESADGVCLAAIRQTF